MNVEESRRSAEEVSEVLKTLANPSRLMALCELKNGELSVGELAKRLGLRDQAMSQQLAILRAKGFVSTRRSGQTVYYFIVRDDVTRVVNILCAEFSTNKLCPGGSQT